MVWLARVDNVPPRIVSHDERIFGLTYLVLCNLAVQCQAVGSSLNLTRGCSQKGDTSCVVSCQSPGSPYVFLCRLRLSSTWSHIPLQQFVSSTADTPDRWLIVRLWRPMLQSDMSGWECRLHHLQLDRPELADRDPGDCDRLSAGKSCFFLGYRISKSVYLQVLAILFWIGKCIFGSCFSRRPNKTSASASRGASQRYRGTSYPQAEPLMSPPPTRTSYPPQSYSHNGSGGYGYAQPAFPPDPAYGNYPMQQMNGARQSGWVDAQQYNGPNFRH